MTDTIPITDTERFRLRFDGIAKDSDRLMEHVVELVHQGRLDQVPGKSLGEVYINAADRRLIDAYFDRQLYAELERYWTGPGVGFVPPHHEDLAGWERLVAEGQPQRAIRLWRNHLANLKPTFWFYVTERNRGEYHKSPHDLTPIASQIAEYNNLVAMLPDRKERLLAMMDQARDFFIEAGATQSDLDRLAEDRAEIEAEKRRSPGKPDPRQMEIDVFWEVIGSAGEGSVAEQLDAVPGRLSRFKATQIKAFDAMLHEQSAKAYRTDLWALAYLLRDGCSDDAFEAFRYWLILQGREKYEAVLADPDAFDVTTFESDIEGCLALWDAPLQANEMRTGKAMKRKNFKLPELAGPDLDDESFERALPKVAAAMLALR